MPLFPPRCDNPTELRRERRRNVAAVRRKMPQTPNLQASVSAWVPIAMVQNRQKLPLCRRSTAADSAAETLTMLALEAYINTLGAPPLLRRDGVCEAPHCLRGERASGHDPMAMSDVRGCGGSGARWRRNHTVPGCLRRESEERETRTAESLRAASRRRSLSPAQGAAGRDFGGRRFRSTLWSLGRAIA